MKVEDFRKIESEDEFVALLREHELYREDDVTFEDIAEAMYVYTGDDFVVDTDVLADLTLSALLVVGNVRLEFFQVSDVLEDYGVFCVTGDVHCKDMRYATESTCVGVGGNLVVENALFADCGNSMLQVNKDLKATLFVNAQCGIDVRGQQDISFDDSVTKEQLSSLGIEVGDDQEPDEAIEAYLERYDD